MQSSTDEAPQKHRVLLQSASGSAGFEGVSPSTKKIPAQKSKKLQER